ncbi:MAG: Aspartate carbamoyltransferase [Candidatus Izimaplasma bacterium HR2]|nr:MAG: Aspartate carbamoyltransferase [Candidatus Izimaplasma bacterium HR2]
MKNLFALKDLSVVDINGILEEAIEFKNGKKYDKLEGKSVVNMFFENSTRTLYSFLKAESNMMMDETNFNPDTSSLKKGESLYDTVKTFESLGYDCFVIRHSQNNYYRQLTNINVPILNGGDGTGNHPTQSLLDLMTIKENFGDFEGLKITIVGDIRHSRVAHTNIAVMKRLGMKVYVSGPKEFDDGSGEYIEFEKAIKEMNIIMLLRVQYERHGYCMTLEKDEYLKKYGLIMERVNKMKDDAIIMHPAPFNRKVEIDDPVVECKKSRIFEQMANGVFVRMAVLKWALE